MPNNQYIDYIELNLPIKLDFWSKFEKKSTTKDYKLVLNTPRVTQLIVTSSSILC